MWILLIFYHGGSNLFSPYFSSIPNNFKIILLSIPFLSFYTFLSLSTSTKQSIMFPSLTPKFFSHWMNSFKSRAALSSPPLHPPAPPSHLRTLTKNQLSQPSFSELPKLVCPSSSIGVLSFFPFTFSYFFQFEI
jgi:hypothetical protein